MSELMIQAFLNFLAAQAADKARLELSANQVALLEYIFKESATGRVLQVGDLITLSELASPATLHNALKALIAKKLLASKTAKADLRYKEIVLAPAGKQYFARLEAAIAQTVK